MEATQKRATGERLEEEQGGCDVVGLLEELYMLVFADELKEQEYYALFNGELPNSMEANRVA